MMGGEVAILLEAARLSLSGALVAIGLVFMAGGALGMLRFPDFYTRLHAVGVSDVVGGVILIVGLALASGDPGLSLRLALFAVLIIASAPTLSHLSANAAHAGGLSPIAGPYVAPRPGAKPGAPR
jgi:multicomponent Na+:H+ antiporter subunit G